jgi:hypothetical protein
MDPRLYLLQGVSRHLQGSPPPSVPISDASIVELVISPSDGEAPAQPQQAMSLEDKDKYQHGQRLIHVIFKSGTIDVRSCRTSSQRRFNPEL